MVSCTNDEKMIIVVEQPRCRIYYKLDQKENLANGLIAMRGSPCLGLDQCNILLDKNHLQVLDTSFTI